MKELKTMIRAYHEAGISVVLDVVYNHIYSTEHGPFQNTVPDYYYRMEPDGRFQNGTGVGNETASEHEMYRKYMIDSLTHWVKEYQIDGFRFDLMGIHDVRTMNVIRGGNGRSGSSDSSLRRRLGHGNRSRPRGQRLRKGQCSAIAKNWIL